MHFPLKRRFLFLATVPLVVSLSRIDSANAAGPGDNSSTQVGSHAARSSLLEQESLVAHVEPGKYSQVRLKPEVKVVSQDFFPRYAKDFDLSRDDVFKLVLSRPNSLQRAKSKHVLRYQQHYKNLPVIGVEYVLQTDSANHVLAASGTILSGLNVDTNPIRLRIRSSGDRETCRTGTDLFLGKGCNTIPTGTLAISFKDSKIRLKNARLVYRFTISSETPSQSYNVEVDAHSGEVVNKINNRISDVVDWNQTIANCQPPGIGTWTSHSGLAIRVRTANTD